MKRRTRTYYTDAKKALMWAASRGGRHTSVLRITEGRAGHARQARGDAELRQFALNRPAQVRIVDARARAAGAPWTGPSVVLVPP
jgi:hypothetical protein